MNEAASDKLYYRIGEVAELHGINTSVLRFWETQFPQLKPQKTKTGQRLYSRQDVDLVGTIYNLLYKDRLTIAGARARITPSRKGSKSDTVTSDSLLAVIQQELQEIRKLLS